ncbi:hypothetical protein CDL15_Pgr001283 [Punica granatum]|uniref:Uncharacterized protein n=1 Tax=Punica granatum TaxID=22663 RepID=A0A218WL22_PUNGR|nr:hypothetical protein CDL15_Pgr001283 [Punica granatum]
MAAIVPQWAVVDFPARVREDPRVLEAGILELATEAEVGFGDLGLGILGVAHGAVPRSGFGGCSRGEGEAAGGAHNGEVGGLLGPRLDTYEVEDGEAKCRA